MNNTNVYRCLSLVVSLVGVVIAAGVLASCASTNDAYSIATYQPKGTGGDSAALSGTLTEKNGC